MEGPSAEKTAFCRSSALSDIPRARLLCPRAHPLSIRTCRAAAAADSLNVIFSVPLAGPHAEFELSPILSIGIFIGILTVIICIIIAVAAALKLRTSQPGKGHHTASGNGKAGGLGKRPGNLPIKEKISLPLSQSEDMYDEKNPDVVPTNEGELRVLFF